MKQIILILATILLVAFPLYSQNGTWNQKANIPTARLFASSCELDGKIYVIGGAKTLSSSLNTMEVYNLETDTWDTTKTNMPTAREELCVAEVNGKIYAIGGAMSHNGGTIYGVVEEYNPVTDSWDTNKQPMPTARKGAACGVINNMIYVAGGSSTGWEPSDILEVYDPASDSWTTKANMLAARYAPQGTVLNDTFYVSGGIIGSPWTGQMAVQKYDPTENKWSSGTNLINGRVGHTTNVIDDKIYAIGGDKQPPVIEAVEEYDPRTETWSVIDQIPSAMICHTSSVSGNEIYLFSGTTKTITQLALTNNVYSYTPPPVSIPDTAFLYALIEEGVDTNGDSLISYVEAEAITTLNVSKYNSGARIGISDMTGIEAFVNLDTLVCSYNSYHSIDVSTIQGLIYLDCSESKLTSLDVTKNTKLRHLDCSDYEIPELDLSNNPDLVYLNCHNNLITSLDLTNNSILERLFIIENQLTTLDISNNTVLTWLSCGNNELTNLDISNNILLKELWLDYMPSLYQVCVWEMPFPPSGVYVNTIESPNVYFTTECSDFEAPSLVAVDTLYQPDFIEATSSEDGMIYLVPENTEKNIVTIRGVCIDSMLAVADAPANVSLSGLDNGIFWLYASDNSGNISEPEVFNIMGVGIDNTIVDQFMIYPNPTKNLLTIETENPDHYSIEITSLNGQQIITGEMEGTLHQIDLSSFQKGVYFITISSQDFVTTKKVIRL